MFFELLKNVNKKMRLPLGWRILPFNLIFTNNEKLKNISSPIALLRYGFYLSFGGSVCCFFEKNKCQPSRANMPPQNANRATVSSIFSVVIICIFYFPSVFVVTPRAQNAAK
jgi:hypothetical protein